MNYKKILVLALPSIASFAAMTATGTINLIMVGSLGALAIAIVGVSNIIMYNVWALFSGIGHTVNYLVAQHYGSNNMRRGVNQTSLALYLCIAANVFIILTGLFASEAILSVMGSSEDLIREGSGYLMVRFLAMTATVFTFVLHGFFRGIGDTRTPMITSLIGNGAMIFFTYALTYGNAGFPEIGLIGAAWAVLIGECTIFLFSAYVYFVVLHKRYHTRSKAKLDRADSVLIATESGKLGAEEFSKSMAMFVFTIFVTQLGTNALASNEVALSVMSFGFMPAFAFGTTATILVGQDIGRGDPLSARRMGTETAVIGSIFILVLGLLEFLFADSIIGMYTNDPEVHGLAVQLIQISAFLQLFDALFNFYAGGLRGIGDTSFLLKISLILSWLFFVPLAYVCTNFLHLESIGAWLSLYGFITAIGIAVMIRFYRVDWITVKLKSENAPKPLVNNGKE